MWVVFVTACWMTLIVVSVTVVGGGVVRTVQRSVHRRSVRIASARAMYHNVTTHDDDTAPDIRHEVR